MAMLRNALLLTSLLLTASAAKFDGCFRNVNEDLGVSFNMEGNVNADCAEYCAAIGYILSATKGSTCHCTNRYPEDGTLLQDAYNITTDGDRNCMTVCPGNSHVTDGGRCEGDICCGDVASNAYSVYAVGGIDILQVILRRIRRTIASKRMAWITVVSTKEFSNSFSRYNIKHGLSVTLDADPYREFYKPSLASCESQCRMTSKCRAFTYLPERSACNLFEKTSMDVDVKPVNETTLLFDRNVTKSDIDVVQGTRFNVEMVNQDFLMVSHPGTDMQPYDEYDFELDLTYSNTMDEFSRSFEVSTAETVTQNTESGFDVESTTSETESSSESRESERGESSSSENSFSASFGVSVKTSAGFDVGFASGEMSMGFSASLSTQLSFSSGSSSSRSRSSSQSKSRESTRSTSNSYNTDYSNTISNQKSTSMTYSMKVPPRHTGTMTFTKENRKTVLKIRSVYQLNGYLKFMVKGREKIVHVSQVLTADERLFATFSCMVFQRPVVTAKTTIRNHKGESINPPQLVPGMATTESYDNYDY